MKSSLGLQLKQALSLSPKLQQAIRLLQLSANELEAEIKAALDTNPLLEIDHQFEDSHWSAAYQERQDLHNFISEEPNLQDYLLWQLNLTPFSDRDHIIAITIIDAINDDGYLSLAIEDIWLGIRSNYPDQFNELELSEVMAVLHRIQQFDPAGIGAGDLAECMLLQLNALEISPELQALCKTLIKDHLELIARKEYAQIKRIMQVCDKDLHNAITQIKHLNPRPGSIITATNIEYITPDISVEKNGSLWQVNLHAHISQSLRINTNYAALMSNANNEFASASLRKQHAEAQWLLESIKNRNLTLLKVATYIVQYQNEFLEKGEAFMRPLTLQVIARDLELSESTISRITTRKYLLTPRGTYELKYFFSSRISADGGETCSSTAVKAIIKQLISEEEHEHPLSDQEITNIIEQRGINIARRTVTKYREALGIQSSNLRGA